MRTWCPTGTQDGHHRRRRAGNALAMESAARRSPTWSFWARWWRRGTSWGRRVFATIKDKLGKKKAQMMEMNITAFEKGREIVRKGVSC